MKDSDFENFGQIFQESEFNPPLQIFAFSSKQAQLRIKLLFKFFPPLKGMI